MPETPAGWALIAATVLFVAFLLFKARFGLPGVAASGSAEMAEARSRVTQAKKRARAAGADRSLRGEAWRDAARAALEGLDRPDLAASYALRATRVNRDDIEAFDLLVQALQGSGRYRALERHLWRRLRRPQGPGYDRAYDALLALYDGPLRRRDQARALRAMRGVARASQAPVK